MCGIAGFAASRPVADRDALARAITCIAHRGPDDSGTWWSADGRVGIGQARLAIIDLSPGGHQPMLDATGELAIVFNGEIYNYRDLRDELRVRGHEFRSASDTEVLLAAYRQWGIDCLDHINGMFALALYDHPRGRVFFARDRAGEKPLFYRHDEQGIRFASELKALMTSAGFPRIIDRGALDCYLAMGYVPGDRCILRGVNKLPPAHAATFDLNTEELRTWRYWEPPAFESNGAGSVDDLSAQLESLLEDAVRRQLVADVPVGVLLSGGVDSSLITAMAVRAASSVKTFTVRFPGFGVYDETGHARLIARHFATEHVELDAVDISTDLFPKLARQFDEPMIDSSMIPTYLVSRLVRDHCTVALGGDGGDELFGGYDHYRRFEWLRNRTSAIPAPLRRAAARAATAILPTGFRGRNWIEALGSDLEREVPPIDVVFDAASRRRLLAAHGWTTSAEHVRAVRMPRHGDLLRRAMQMDFENYLPEDILVKVDRASMLTALEVRAPFLDYRVIEFAFGRVPSDLKADATRSKILLKQLCGRVLPAEFDKERKQGFSIPLAHWLQSGPWAELMNEVLIDPPDALFDRSAVKSLLDGQRKGRNNSERLFGLALFELWRREYGATLPSGE